MLVRTGLSHVIIMITVGATQICVTLKRLLLSIIATPPHKVTFSNTLHS